MGDMMFSDGRQSVARLVTEVRKCEAWVVFSGQSDLFYLRWLKAGFRHCYVVLNDGDHWVSVDPLSCHTEVVVHDLAPDFDLPAWLAKRGDVVVAAPVATRDKPAPWGIWSCVEAVKRVLGVHTIWVQTPYQLYRYLMKLS